MPDGTLAAITTMYKVDGFDASRNDWFWLKNDPAGVLDVEGQGRRVSFAVSGAILGDQWN
jgi:hypothetical protein